MVNSRRNTRIPPRFLLSICVYFGVIPKEKYFLIKHYFPPPLQVLNLRSNNLYDLPPNLFHGMKNLRLIDLSDNKLNFLSEYSFREDSLEVVWLAQNRFVRIPFKSFSSMVAASLRELDLSFNSIDSLYSPEFRSAAIFKVCKGQGIHSYVE